MKSVLDIEQINGVIDKIAMYKKQEDISFDKIKQNLLNLNVPYKTNNTNRLNNISLEIMNKFGTIAKIHSNNMLVLQKNVIKYRETARKVARKFDNIDIL